MRLVPMYREPLANLLTEKIVNNENANPFNYSTIPLSTNPKD